jgi:hypothetical protein
MSKRSWLGLVVASFVMTASGAAFSGNPPPPPISPIELLDYDASTDVLDGLPPGSNAQEYLHTDQSVHNFTPPIEQFPNGPCRGYAVEWNRQVDFAIDHGVDLETRRSFQILLTHMAENACNASISSDTSQNPAPIVSINPVP